MAPSSYPNSESKKLVGVAIGFVAAIAVVAGLLWYLHSRDGAAQELAGSSDPNDRGRAAERLRGRRSDAALRTLRSLSKDKDKWVAIKAVRAIGDDRSAYARDALVEILQDKEANASARGEAASTLGKFKDADPQVLTHALTSDPAPEARAGAAKGLRRMRKPETIPQLVQALEDGDPRVRTWAITAIHKMIARRFPYDARKSPQAQRQEINRIKAYLRSVRALPG
jgi:hypothetical protein